MALEDDIKNIKKLNEEIETLSKKLREPTKIFEEGEINQAKLYIKSLRNELLKVDSDLSYIADSFRRSVKELSKQNTFLNQGKKSLRGISDISSQLLRIKYGEVDASSQDISKLLQKAKIKEDELRQSIILLETAENQTDEIKAQTKELEKSLKNMTAFKSGAEDVLAIQKSIEKNAGVMIFSGLEDLTNAIPGLRKFTGAFTEASKAAKETARTNILDAEAIKEQNKSTQREYEKKVAQRKSDEDSLKSGKGLTKEVIKRLGLEKQLVGINKKGQSISLAGNAASAKASALSRKKLLKPIAPPKVPIPKKLPSKMSKMFRPLLAGFKALGPMILKSLGPIGLLISLISNLVSAIIASDKATGELARNLNISYRSALKVRDEFFRIATAAGDNYVLTEGIQKSNEAITKQLGIQQKIMSSGLLVSMTKLRERAGFTNDELLGAVNLQLSSKKTLDEITTEILGQTKLTSLQNNVNIDQKEVLRDISKISKATTLSLGKNPSALADAVTQARALGMTLSQIESISENLLNFESSLTNELKAELLLGRNINLERARLFAINNNIAGVAKEISSQIGNSADFAKMNVLQQKALAEAVGMNREELAKTLFVQENITATTDDEIIKQKFLLRQLTDKYGIEEARRRVGEESLDTLMNQVSVTDDFNAMLNKLKEIFVGIAPTILFLAKELASLLESVGKFMSFFSGTPILNKPRGDDFSVNPNVTDFDQAVDSIPTPHFMVNPQAALGGALAKGLIKAFNQPTNTNNPLENERNRAQQEQFRKQNQQMQELINATVENRPPVDVFGGLYGD